MTTLRSIDQFRKTEGTKYLSLGYFDQTIQHVPEHMGVGNTFLSSTCVSDYPALVFRNTTEIAATLSARSMREYFISRTRSPYFGAVLIKSNTYTN